MQHPLWERESKLEEKMFSDYQAKEIGVALPELNYALQKAFWSGALYALNDLKNKRLTIKTEAKNAKVSSQSDDG